MGIRLIVDVLRQAPTTLTHREKLLLVALAEDANDDTRITWNSVEHPDILRGAQVSRSQLYAVLKKLLAKGVLEKMTAGQKNGSAKYRIPSFENAQCPQNADTENESQCPGTADTETPQGPENADTDTGSQRPGIPDTDPSQCQQIWDVSVSKSGTPTPHPSASQPAPVRHAYGIPDDARPLVDALTAAGVTVRWPFKNTGWYPVLALIAKSGIPAMVDHAVNAARRADVQSASYFMRGWSELPPLPPQRPHREQPAPPPHCGHIDCDPVTRTREHEDDRGLRANYPCPDCHPETRKANAA